MKTFDSLPSEEWLKNHHVKLTGELRHAKKGELYYGPYWNLEGPSTASYDHSGSGISRSWILIYEKPLPVRMTKEQAEQRFNIQIIPG